MHFFPTDCVLKTENTLQCHRAELTQFKGRGHVPGGRGCEMFFLRHASLDIEALTSDV